MSCIINEEILERLYEDFLEILAKDNKLPLEQREKEAARLAQEEFERRQQKVGEKYANKYTTKKLYDQILFQIGW